MKKFLKIFFKIIGSLFLILIAIFTIWFSKNWKEAGREIKTSENYSKLDEISTSGPATENQKIILNIQGWPNESYWPCSAFHLKLDIPYGLHRNFTTRRSHLKRIFVACRLERDFSPSQLRSYFFKNTYVGNREYGVEKLSQSLFKKPVQNLTQREAIQIGIIITGPSRYRNNHDLLDERTAYWLEKLEDK